MKSNGWTHDLQQIVEAILIDAKPVLLPANKNNSGLTVNWADLHCVDILVSLIDGNITVVIEEASPESFLLQEYVRSELQKRGYENVCVNTEW